VVPDRHFELPAHPDLEYYRKQAKALPAPGDRGRGYRTAGELLLKHMSAITGELVLGRQRYPGGQTAGAHSV
jgi:hypothetical protein